MFWQQVNRVEDEAAITPPFDSFQKAYIEQGCLIKGGSPAL